MEIIWEKFNKFQKEEKNMEDTEDTSENIDQIISMSEEEQNNIIELFHEFSGGDNLKDVIMLKLHESYYFKNLGATGYIYCLHNEMFKHYGENVYRIGCATNVNKRCNSYKKYYPKKIYVVHKSKRIKHYTIAEKLVFKLLIEYRMKEDKDFFRCKLELIKETG